MIDLGVMNEQGKIIHARYDKFRQINRFLEFIEDILPRLSRDREITILDFGCGKSYLTFAMYYYLRELKGYDVNIIGLDLKTDVIEKCNSLALRYGYEKLHFYHGDIADYEGVSCVDMVVTLHACDTATDYALAKAVEWGAEVILSVPCCQHEVNKQIKNEMLEPVLRYGILKERMSALITDAVRADLLESKGYDTQILEFIDMEHTPKNLLIRAVRTGKRSDQGKVEKMLAALNIHPTLDRLLNEKEQEGSCAMKRILKKAGILLLVFLLSTAGTALLLNSGSTDNRSDFNDAVFPEVMVDMNDTLINRMYGYAQPMQADFTRDSVTPLDTSKKLTFKVNPYDSEVKSFFL